MIVAALPGSALHIYYDSSRGQHYTFIVIVAEVSIHIIVIVAEVSISDLL